MTDEIRLLAIGHWFEENFDTLYYAMEHTSRMEGNASPIAKAWALRPPTKFESDPPVSGAV